MLQSIVTRVQQLKKEWNLIFFFFTLVSCCFKKKKKKPFHLILPQLHLLCHLFVWNSFCPQDVQEDIGNGNMNPAVAMVDQDTGVIIVTEDGGRKHWRIFNHLHVMSCLDISGFKAQLTRRTVTQRTCFHVPKVLLYTFGQILNITRTTHLRHHLSSSHHRCVNNNTFLQVAVKYLSF